MRWIYPGRPARSPAAVLRLPPDHGRSPLVVGLVHQQHRLRVAELLDQLASQIVSDAIGIPGRAGQQGCIPSPLASPACVAIVQHFFLGSSASSPATNARARRRGSTLANRAPTRPPQLVEDRLPPGRVYWGE